jgi:hypothetical protein
VGLFAIGFGLAFGLAAWRNVPPIEGWHSAGAVALVLLALGAAFLAGRTRRVVSTAVAVAQADADARAMSVVQLSVHTGQGEAATPGASRGARLTGGAVLLEPSTPDPPALTGRGSDRLPWLDDDPAARLAVALQDGGATDDGLDT